MIILLVLVATLAFYWYLIRPHSYWKRNGVPQQEPTFLFGNMLDIIFRRAPIPDINLKIYNTDPNSRYVGLYQFLSPILIVKDPEIIKQIAVKNFDHFTDHKGFASPEGEVLFGKNLFFLRAEKWREMRSLLSPAFTSSKMKYIFSLMEMGGQRLAQHFLDKNRKQVDVEMRDVASRFANDVIAQTVFGFDCDSFKNPENEFYLMGKEASDFTSIRKMISFVGYTVSPWLMAKLKFSFFSPRMTQFFIKIVKENIESREKHNVTRPDMISLLLEARKNNLKHEAHPDLPDTGFATVDESEIGKQSTSKKINLTDEDIAAQALIFFFAGFDSVATLICYMAHELAANPEVQDKLRAEVDAVRQKCQNKLTYEAVASMKYLDMVVTETLRKYPSAIATDRLCTKPFTIEPKLPNEKPVTLQKGDQLYVAIYGIHRDPKYYPEPDRFDPERFNEENRSKIASYTYLPFGIGPRSCIGSRFALLESKIFIYHVLSHFELVPNEQTQIPIKFSKKIMNMGPEKGFFLGLRRRED